MTINTIAEALKNLYAKLGGTDNVADVPTVAEMIDKVTEVAGTGGGGLPSVTSADEGKVLSVVEDTQTQTFIPLQHITFDQPVALEGVTMDASSFSEDDKCVITIGENQYTAVWTVYEGNSSFFWEGSGDDSIMIAYNYAEFGDGWRVYVYIEGEEAGDISAVVESATGSYSWAAVDNRLVVSAVYDNDTDTYTLNKTWQEIYDVASAGGDVQILAVGRGSFIKFLVLRMDSDSELPAYNVYCVNGEVGVPHDTLVWVKFKADSPTGYPATVSQG